MHAFLPDLIPPVPHRMVLAGELLKPYFVFQVLSVCIWFSEDYFLYSYVVLALTFTSSVYGAHGTSQLSSKCVSHPVCI